MAKLSTSTNIDWVQVKEQGSASTTPASGYGRVCCKSDGLYFLGDNGTEIGPLAAASGSTGYTQGARVTNSGDISCSADTLTVITFNTESYDTDGIHSTSVNTGRLTCQTAGKYLIHGSVTFVAGDPTTRKILRIRLNGTTEIASAEIGVNTSGAALHVETLYSLAANDYLELIVYPVTNNCTVGGTGAYPSFSPVFEMQRIG